MDKARLEELLDALVECAEGHDVDGADVFYNMIVREVTVVQNIGESHGSVTNLSIGSLG